MNKLNKILLSAVAGMMLVGCASTSSNSSSGGQYPVLKVLSDKPYVWDDSISEALNVARMAQPAGVGNGMRDFADGTQANTGRLGAGIRTFDAGVGLLSQGIFGVIAHESLSQGVNRQLDWKPSIVDFVPVSNISEKNGIKDIQSFIGNKIFEAIKKDFPNLTWHGEFTVKRKGINNFNTDFIFYEKDACREALLFSYIEKENAKIHFEKIPDANFFEDTSGIDKFCEYGGKLSIAGKRFVDGVENYIVVFEVAFGHFFDKSIAENYDGYFIMPEKYSFVAVDKPLRISINRNYAAVYNRSKEILFQK